MPTPRMPVTQLYFTDTSVPARPNLVAGAACQSGARRHRCSRQPRAPRRYPFILGDDGSYDLDLNRFFRECTSMGVRSPNSVRRICPGHRHLGPLYQALRGRGDRVGGHRQRAGLSPRARAWSPAPARLSSRPGTAPLRRWREFYGWAWDEGLLAATPLSRSAIAKPGGKARPQRRGHGGRQGEAGQDQGGLQHLDLDRSGTRPARPNLQRPLQQPRAAPLRRGAPDQGRSTLSSSAVRVG